MFMGKTYQEFSPVLQADAILVVRGRVSRRDDGLNLHAQSAFSPDLGAMDETGPLVLLMAEQRASEDLVGELLQRSEERREGKSVSVRVDLGGRRIIKKKNKYKIHTQLLSINT